MQGTGGGRPSDEQTIEVLRPSRAEVSPDFLTDDCMAHVKTKGLMPFGCPRRKTPPGMKLNLSSLTHFRSITLRVLSNSVF